MVLRHEDVRTAAKDWKTYSSDAPFRVPIPSEEGVRTMRQLPIETNPPDHTEYREIVEPFFKRAKDPAVIAQVTALIDALLTDAMGRNSIEVVREFALPLQSRALTFLLNVPPAEAETWISWGIHVFHHGGDGKKKGAALETYLQQRLDQAAANPGEDFFRIVTPLTHIGRVCPVETNVHGVTVKAGERISLNWASANQDATVFTEPGEVKLDRKPNPHVAFGFGAHVCLGAPHARLLLRTLLEKCVEHVGRITVLAAQEHIETEAVYQRVVGYDSLTIRMTPR